MKKTNMADLPKSSRSGKRQQAEADQAHASLGDGRARRRAGRSEQVIFRCTPEKRQQLVRIAEMMSVNKFDTVTFGEVFDRALDLIEAEIKAEHEVAQ
jgi:hypothetical protein